MASLHCLSSLVSQRGVLQMVEGEIFRLLESLFSILVLSPLTFS